MTAQWLANQYEDYFEVVPIGEEDWHRPDKKCRCGPEIRAEKGLKPLIVHNSFDGREHFEQVDTLSEFRNASKTI